MIGDDEMMSSSNFNFDQSKISSRSLSDLIQSLTDISIIGWIGRIGAYSPPIMYSCIVDLDIRRGQVVILCDGVICINDYPRQKDNGKGRRSDGDGPDTSGIEQTFHETHE